MQDAVHPKYLLIRLDESEGQVIASFAPDGDTATITLDDFKRAVNEAGFGGYRLNEPSMAVATGKYNSGAPFDIVIGEAVDGTFSIRISDDHMDAYLTCALPLGGAPVQKESILQEATRKGIAVKLDIEAIERALKEGGKDVLIASAKAPVPGTDGKVESLIPNLSNRRPHLDEHGLADFRDLGEIYTVHTGEALMRHIPPTSGEPGLSLSGKAIPAKAGKDVSFATKLNGVFLDPKNPNVLVAAIDGCPVLDKNEVSVEPVYTVKNVDLHTGNIIFKGAVHVTGDVHTGMSIQASGDIHIEGTVEGATLDAGGDIVVKGGILGESEHGHGHDDASHSAITCAGSCTARFVQNAHISAGNGIFIHDYVMQSELSAGHQIIVGDTGSRKGNIIGGTTRAAMLVKAHVIGANTYVRTVVIAGAAQALHERLKTASETREAAEQKLADIIKLLDLAHANPGRIPPETIKSAAATRDAINAEIETLREDEKQLQAEIDLANGAQVVVEKQVFGGVEVRFGLKLYKVVADRQGGIFRMKEDELVYE